MPPASLGRPPVPSDQPASSLGPLHTPTCLAFCGVSVTFRTPSLGVRPRLSPQAAHDDWNPGQRGFQSFYVQDSCQTRETQNSAIFLAFPKSPTLDILDNFGQCPKCPNRCHHTFEANGLMTMRCKSSSGSLLALTCTEPRSAKISQKLSIARHVSI
jgi:hypothetical protein